MGDRDLSSLSKDRGIARSIAARENLDRIVGNRTMDRSRFEAGNRIQGELRDTGTSDEVAEVLESLGEIATNLPGTLTPDEELDLRARAFLLEGHVGGMHLLPVVLTWLMREPVRNGEISLELIQRRPAQPRSFADTLRAVADSLDGGNPHPPSAGSNIRSIRRLT